jgi:hypothetical protein
MGHGFGLGCYFCGLNLKRMLRYFIGLVAIVTIFSSCSTDLDLTGNYTEKAVIYGLLDPKDNPNVGGEGHFFRIQKAFLGEESAFIMALEPDSSYFKVNEVRVELIEFNGDNESNRWELDTVTVYDKDTVGTEGEVLFFGPAQRLYKAPVNIDPDRTYRIELTKIGGGSDSLMADALTEVVDPSTFAWTAPNQNSPAIPGTTRKLDLFGTTGQFKDYTIRFDVAARAVQYEVWLRFHYREIIGGTTTEKSVVWKVSTIEIPSNVTNWQVQLSAEAIYNKIASDIEPLEGVVRIIGLAEGSAGDAFPGDNFSHDMDFFIRLAGQDLYKYIDINNPTNAGVLQDKPVYTNINNGLGVLSSRSDVEFRGLYLSTTASQQLVSGIYTGDLGFTDD